MSAVKFYVSIRDLLFVQSYIVKHSDQKTILYKAKIKTNSSPHLQLRNSSGTAIGTAIYNDDALEQCTRITLHEDTFDLRFDDEGPVKDKRWEYWTSPAYNGSTLSWNFIDARTKTCCIEGDESRPQAVMRWTVSFGNSVGEIELLNWPADKIDEIVMLALTSLQRRSRLFGGLHSTN